MSVQVFCPKCDRSCRIKAELLGRRVRCPDCHEIFRAEEVPVADAEDDMQELEQERSSNDESDLPTINSDRKVKPGKVENPFDEASRLAAETAAVDPSLFEFDFGDEAPPKKKGEDEDESDRRKKHRDDDDDDRPRSRRHDEDDDDADAEDERRRAEKKKVDAEQMRKSKPASKSEISLPGGSKSLRPLKDSAPADSPFNFGDDAETPSSSGSKKPHVSRRDEEEEEDDRPTKPKRPPEKKTAARGNASDADFLGLQDLDEPAPKRSEDEKPKKKQSKRKFFHVRQSGFWSEALLFRVFVHEGDMVFVTAACGKEVAAMELAIQGDSLEDCEKKIRHKLRDLNELPIDELAEKDRHGFRFAAQKIVSATINAPPFGLLRKHGAAAFVLVHKSKGEISFDFPSDDDVDRAIDYLPDLLDDLLEVNVRWDKANERFIKR